MPSPQQSASIRSTIRDLLREGRALNLNVHPLTPERRFPASAKGVDSGH